MDFDAKNQTNFKPKFVTPAGIVTTPTLSGVPLPVIPKKPRKWKMWAGILAFVILSAGSYWFYVSQLNSPEVVLIKSLQKYLVSPGPVIQGEINFASASNKAQYDALADWNLAPKNLFTEAEKVNLKSNFKQITAPGEASSAKKQIEINYEFSDPEQANKIFTVSYEVRILNKQIFGLFKNLPMLNGNGSEDKWVNAGEAKEGERKTPIDANIIPSAADVDFGDYVGNTVNSFSLIKARKDLQKLAVFSELKGEDINGVPARRIQMRIGQENLENIANLLKEQNKLNPDREKAIKVLAKDLESFRGEFWIEKKDLALRQMKAELKIRDQNGKPLEFSVLLNFPQNQQAPQILEPKNALTVKEFEQYLIQTAVMSDDFNNRGFALFNQGNNIEARALLEKAIKYNINNYHSYNSLGLIYADGQNYNEAIKQYKTALQINPEHDKAAINLVTALFKKGDCEGAVTEAEKFIKKFPHSQFLTEAYFWEGNAYFCQKQPEQAVKIFLAGLLADPSSPLNADINGEMGSAYYQLKQYEKARDAWLLSTKLLLKNHPVNYEAVGMRYMQLSDAYVALRQFALARGALNSAAKYNPKLLSDPVYNSAVNGIGMLENWPKDQPYPF